MAETEGFVAVDESEEFLFGPRGLIVCGLSVEHQHLLLGLLGREGLSDVPVCFALQDKLEQRLEDVLAGEPGQGLGQEYPMPRAVIMSGFRQRELHALMTGYRQAGLPRPLWATLTPTSASWTVRALVRELMQEDQAMSARQGAT